MINEIEKNLFLIRKNITETCRLYDLKAKRINLVAVSKTRNIEEITNAINLGCNIFGENYLQEAKEKFPQIKQKFPQIKLHFIGHLQSNKAKDALELFDVIETLDREKMANAFKNEIAKNSLFAKREFFIQVNIGDEAQKGGINPKLLKEFYNFAKNDCGLNVTGLMCIPPQDEKPTIYFAALAKLAKENNIQNLSMGMSLDYEEAIALGANYIRIGTAIFGKRD